MKEIIIKKCLSCGATMKVIEDCKCKCAITCCGKEMRTMIANEENGAIEKHKPTYIKEEDNIIVTVPHIMEKEHYIEWIALVTDNKEEYIYLNPEDTPKVKFKNVDKGKIYSYCNKHGLWVEDIK